MSAPSPRQTGQNNTGPTDISQDDTGQNTIEPTATTRRRRRTNRLYSGVVAAAVAAATLGIATPALAQEGDGESGNNESGNSESDTAEMRPEIDRTHDVGRLVERCDNAIVRRLDNLATAETRLDSIAVLTADHDAALAAIIDNTQAGLAVLQADIAAAGQAGDWEATRELCAKIAPDFRVYLVVLPQAHLTVGADRVDAAVERANGLVAKFDEALTAAEAAGADVTEAVTLRVQVVAHLAAADTSADGTADSVLAVTPASYNDGPGGDTLDAARTALRTSHGELKDAHADAKAAVMALREAIGEIDNSGESGDSADAA